MKKLTNSFFLEKKDSELKDIENLKDKFDRNIIYYLINNNLSLSNEFLSYFKNPKLVNNKDIFGNTQYSILYGNKKLIIFLSYLKILIFLILSVAKDYH